MALNHQYYADGIARHVSDLQSIIKSRDAEIARLKEDMFGGGFRELKKYKTCSRSKSSYRSPGELRKVVEESYKHDLSIKEENQVAIAHNRKLLEKAIQTMKGYGLPDEVVVVKKGRGYQTERKAAEWLLALRREAETVDGWPYIEAEYKRQIAECDKWQKEVDDAIARDERAKESARKALDERIKAGIVAVKYGMSATDSPLDVRDAIILKDQYLHLAHWMRKNRGDWSDGPEYAKCGLVGFTSRTPEDNEIVKEMIDLISNWPGDGRCFRDCTWNYNRLFSMANQEIIADYEIVSRACGD